MFYLFDSAGFALGSFKTKAEALAEMVTYADADDLFVTTDPDPW